MSKMTAVTATAFKEKVLGKGFALVDVYADWCGPCQVLTPLLEKLAESGDFPKVKFFKLNAERASKLCEKYDIRALPTLLIFEGGENIARLEGSVGKPRLTAWIKKSTQTT